MCSAVVLGMGALAHAQAQAPNKVAIIAVQNALLATKDGQKATQELQAKFNPKKSELEQKQSQIVSMQDQLKKGSATLGDAAKSKLQGDMERLNTQLTRDNEDFEAE